LLRTSSQVPPILTSEESSFSARSEPDDSGMFIRESSSRVDLSYTARPAKKQKGDRDVMLPTGAGPEPPSSHCDPRPSGLNIHVWVDVSVRNELEAGAISLYLETDHPFLGPFDVDLFVSSLINCDLKFCSSFLVCSFLAYATVSTTNSLARQLRLHGYVHAHTY
jgi:hypothetical protein